MYDRLHTINIPYIRGLANVMPVFTILFFVFTLANTGIPLSLNFLGEQLSLIGIWERNPVASVLGATGIVFSAIYSIYLYNRLSYGVYSPHLEVLQDVTRREFNVLIALLIPTVILGIFPNIILDSLHLSVSTLLYNIPSTPFLELDLLDAFCLAPVMLGKLPFNYNHKIFKSFSTKNDNTNLRTIGSLYSNTDILKDHTVESIQNLAKKEV